MNIFEKITVQQTLDIPLIKAWDLWTNPAHIVHWNYASEDWQTTHSENDLRAGGHFKSRMEAKDGSGGFDFGGIYDEVSFHGKIVYTMSDNRTVSVTFEEQGHQTLITETFDAEKENPLEMQIEGWQAILDHFKKYAESTVK